MKLAILGSTGSVGTQALEVLEALDLNVSVVALAAGTNVARLAQQVQRWQPQVVAVAEVRQLDQLAPLIDSQTEILCGPEGLIACATQAQRVLNALVDARGLAPTLAALEAGIDVALANKESLVVGGMLVQAALEKTQTRLLPVDSEHSALSQLLAPHSPQDVEQLILTASGGALRDWPIERLAQATPQDVLKHPNWAMGARITVDSATLVNKAFEVIEAHWLFDLPFERIDTVLYPQSLVHGMVVLRDGAVLAHLGMPDMKVPIQYALTAPRHLSLDVPRVDWRARRLDFDDLDLGRYPAFETVLEAAKRGGTAPAALNAADEVLVDRFLKGEISFCDIASGLQSVLARYQHHPTTLKAVLETDAWARELAVRL